MNRLGRVAVCGADLANALDTSLDVLTGGDAEWGRTTWPTHDGTDAARSGDIDDDEVSEMQVKVGGAGTLTFYGKVSSEESYDWLEFYIDGVRQDRISGSVNWAQKSYNITGAGNHTLLWRYDKDDSGSAGSDCAWVDRVQWSGDTPDVNGVPEITYTYDPSGRRIAKAVDAATTVKYLYDGDQCIAEYDGNGDLLRKYIYGPGVDQPICMIDVNDSNAVYYYHFDALGSVVALSDADGDTVQVYEYDVYGQVAASDPNHPNPFLFTGRRFDSETGLYYHRARYYNPYIGRFLQTDPVGYRAGINLYRYCWNNPGNVVDPSGMNLPTISIAFYDGDDSDRTGEFFKNAADDMDEMVDLSECPTGMSITAWVKRQLRRLKRKLGGQGIGWDEVAAVYFFDHSAGPTAMGVNVLEMGDEKLVYGSGEVREFAEMLDSELPAEAYILFGHCDLGNKVNRELFTDLASTTTLQGFPVTLGYGFQFDAYCVQASDRAASVAAGGLGVSPLR